MFMFLAWTGTTPATMEIKNPKAYTSERELPYEPGGSIAKLNWPAISG